MLRESKAADRYRDLGMSVRDRREDPAVMMREYYCPSCAAALIVDIAVEGTETLKSSQAHATV